jgi:hypothetical protein
VRPSDVLAYKRIMLDRIKDDALDGWLWTPKGELPTCPLYFVSAEMTEVAKAAGATLPCADLPVQQMPSETGLMMFDRPIGTVSFQDAIPDVVGVIWHIPDQGAYVNSDHDCGVPEDCGCPDEYLAIDDLVVAIHPLVLFDGCPIPCGLVEWRPAGYPKPEQDEPEYEPGVWTSVDVDDGIEAEQCIGETLLASWVLMQQSLAWTEREHADRGERRRWMRSGRTPAEILVVKLRRMQERPEPLSEELVAWSHRWLVGGHWRQQFYPSTQSHKPVWISPHVKGPADKPLVLKEKVTAWVR